MRRQKILFVSHCVLNTAAKVVSYPATEDTPEETARRAFLSRALAAGVQLVQLPCPEFTLYGASRWGHTKEQFDNPFFRDHCRTILAPLLQQMRAYLQPDEGDKFQVLGIVGIEGSPSCGVSCTCSGRWGGEFSGRENLSETLAAVSCQPGKGVLMEVLEQLMQEEGISLPMLGLDGKNPQPLMDLLG